MVYNTASASRQWFPNELISGIDNIWSLGPAGRNIMPYIWLPASFPLDCFPTVPSHRMSLGTHAGQDAGSKLLPYMRHAYMGSQLLGPSAFGFGLAIVLAVLIVSFQPFASNQTCALILNSEFRILTTILARDCPHYNVMTNCAAIAENCVILGHLKLKVVLIVSPRTWISMLRCSNVTF